MYLKKTPIQPQYGHEFPQRVQLKSLPILQHTTYVDMFLLPVLTPEIKQEIKRVQDAAFHGSYVQGDENIFHPSTDEEIELYFKDGWGIGCYCNGQMIAYAMVQLRNHKVNENYPALVKKFLHFTDRDIELTVCNRGIAVDPAFQGNGLQCRIQDAIREYLTQERRYKYVMCTVSRDCNPRSYHNLEKSGFSYISNVEIFSGRKRAMMIQYL